MNQSINYATALQSENTLKISCDVTRVMNDDQGLKSLLAASNDSCFFIDFASTQKKNRENGMCVLQDAQKCHASKENRKNSTTHRAKLGVEIELFECLYSKESKEIRKKIIDRIQELKQE